MTLILVTLHLIVCFALIMIVLLQTGKGADMGAAFGGGSSQTLLGSSGASTLLSKATTIVAIVFMLTSLALAYTSGRRNAKPSIMKSVETPAEVEETGAAGNAGDKMPEKTQNKTPDDTNASQP